ncbi:MAG: hypothetical protein GF313_07050 [Caldithrix sp.]|nr:hypothetical protein [Caldithrix sp.]
MRYQKNIALRGMVGLITGMFLLVLFACKTEQKPKIPADDKLELANAYYTNGLYEAAATEYLDYLDSYQLDGSRRANTYYTIANIYFERLNDYDKALQYYFKVKYLYPESRLQSEVGKRIVNCLERLGRSSDAQRKMQQKTALDPSQVQESRPGAVIARIGSTKITTGDLQHEMSNLPNYMHQEMNDPKKKIEFLKQYIVQELLYDSAKRQGLDEDKEVIEGAFRAKKALMAEKMLRQELQDKVDIPPEDVELYYLAHKDKYTEKDEEGNVVRQKPLNEVSQQAARDLAAERQQKAYQKLIDRLMKAEDVKIYEQRIQ